MQSFISRLDMIPGTFTAPDLFGREHLLILEKEIDQRRENLKKQVEIQHSLITSERKKSKKLVKSMQSIQKQNVKLRDEYLSILNTNDFRYFLTMDMQAIFEI